MVKKQVNASFSTGTSIMIKQRIQYKNQYLISFNYYPALTSTLTMSTNNTDN